MIAIPFQVSETEWSIFIALQDDNLERMKQYDPASVTIAKCGEPWTHLKLRDVIIGYATPADLDHIFELQRNGHGREALQHLSRGFRFRPERGDSLADAYNRIGT